MKLWREMKLYREVNKPTKYVLQDWTRKGSYGMCPYIGHLEPCELPTEWEINKMFPVNFSEPKDSPYNLMQLAKRNGAKAITNLLKGK
jgi:hypothetical protein